MIANAVSVRHFIMFIHFKVSIKLLRLSSLETKCSAAAETGDRLDTIDMGQKLKGVVLLNEAIVATIAAIGRATHRHDDRVVEHRIINNGGGG